MIQSLPQRSKDESLSDIIRINNGKIISNDQSDSDDEHTVEHLVQRKKYGNMKVLFDGGRTITIGPDYLCFLPTFIAFCVASYFVISLVYSTTQNVIFRLVTLIMCLGQPLSYLLVALSNPGVIVQSADHLESSQQKKCAKCIMMVPRNSRHCRDCDVCIEQYDHHCPWTSKCIGGGNLVRFYIFLGWTPIYLIFITVAFVACMSSNLIQIQQVQKSA